MYTYMLFFRIYDRRKLKQDQVSVCTHTVFVTCSWMQNADFCFCFVLCILLGFVAYIGINILFVYWFPRQAILSLWISSARNTWWVVCTLTQPVRAVPGRLGREGGWEGGKVGGLLLLFNSVLQKSPENDRKRANVTCLVYSYDGKGTPHTCTHTPIGSGWEGVSSSSSKFGQV